MLVDLTKTQIKNLIDFIELNFIDSVREDEDVDNIDYIIDMCEALTTLRKTKEECESGDVNK